MLFVRDRNDVYVAGALTSFWNPTSFALCERPDKTLVDDAYSPTLSSATLTKVPGVSFRKLATPFACPAYHRCFWRSGVYSPLADDPLDTCVGPAAAPENLSTPARFCIVPQQDLGRP